MRDVTATYNGGSDVSICTLRAESGFQEHQAPMLAIGRCRRNSDRDEIEAYCAAEGWNADDAKPIRRAKRRL